MGQRKQGRLVPSCLFLFTPQMAVATHAHGRMNPCVVPDF